MTGASVGSLPIRETGRGLEEVFFSEVFTRCKDLAPRRARLREIFREVEFFPLHRWYVWLMADKEVPGQPHFFALLLCLKQTIPTFVLAGSIAASRSRALLSVTETVFFELPRTDWSVFFNETTDERDYRQSKHE